MIFSFKIGDRVKLGFWGVALLFIILCPIKSKAAIRYSDPLLSTILPHIDTAQIGTVPLADSVRYVTTGSSYGHSYDVLGYDHSILKYLVYDSAGSVHTRIYEPGVTHGSKIFESMELSETNHQVQIKLNLLETSEVDIRILNELGHTVTSRIGRVRGGESTIIMPNNTIPGTIKLPNGVYFVRLSIGDYVTTQKIRISQ